MKFAEEAEPPAGTCTKCYTPHVDQDLGVCLENLLDVVHFYREKRSWNPQELPWPHQPEGFRRRWGDRRKNAAWEIEQHKKARKEISEETDRLRAVHRRFVKLSVFCVAFSTACAVIAAWVAIY